MFLLHLLSYRTALEWVPWQYTVTLVVATFLWFFFFFLKRTRSSIRRLFVFQKKKKLPEGEEETVEMRRRSQNVKKKLSEGEKEAVKTEEAVRKKTLSKKRRRGRESVSVWVSSFPWYRLLTIVNGPDGCALVKLSPPETSLWTESMNG